MAGWMVDWLVGLAGVLAPVAWLERHRRRADFGHAAFVGVHRNALLTVDGILGTARHFRLAADDAMLAAHSASVTATADVADRRTPVAARTARARMMAAVLVLAVEGLQRKATVRLLPAAATLGNVRVVKSHRFGLVDLQLCV